MTTATKSKRVTSTSIRENAKRDMSPKWDNAQDWTSAQFTKNFYNSMEFYRLEKSVKDLKPKLIEWMHNSGYSKDDINAVRKTKDKYFSGTAVGVAACLVKGMPEVHAGFNNGKNTAVWLRNEIEKVVSAGANDLEDDEDAPKVEKPVIYTPSIQDRLRDAAGEMSEELDYAIDSWSTDPEAFDPKAFKVVNLLKGKGAKAAHARLIKNYFQRGLDELHELASGKADEQLKEGYSNRPRKHIKKLIEFYESIAAACDQIAAEQKVLKKPRAKKVKPAEQLVSKVKFMLTDAKLNITSVPPATIIGAQGLVVYNTKTRKLGMYTSKTSAGLNVKGTSITNFTEKSVQKTLRKPEVQLKDFKDQNTQRRVETWIGAIKTTGILLNGRINEDIVLLKVFK